MDEREKWRERIRDIRARGTTMMMISISLSLLSSDNKNYIVGQIGFFNLGIEISFEIDLL